jgi:hypothetical protein
LNRFSEVLVLQIQVSPLFPVLFSVNQRLLRDVSYLLLQVIALLLALGQHRLVGVHIKFEVIKDG